MSVCEWRAQDAGGPALCPAGARDGVAGWCCSPLLRHLPTAGTDPQDRVLVVRKCFQGRKIRVSPEGLLLGLSEVLVHSVDS